MNDDFDIHLLCSLRKRLRGLLFKAPDDKAVLLVPCADVHTFGMRHSIDVAFIDVQGVVMSSYQGVCPRKRLRQKGAAAVLERFSGSGKKWVQPGDRLGITKRSAK